MYVWTGVVLCEVGWFKYLSSWLLGGVGRGGVGRGSVGRGSVVKCELDEMSGAERSRSTSPRACSRLKQQVRIPSSPLAGLDAHQALAGHVL